MWFVMSRTLPWTRDICVTPTICRLTLGYFSYVCLSCRTIIHTHIQPSLAASLFNFPSRYHDPEETVVYRCLTVSSSYEKAHNNVYIVVGDARDKTLSCCSQEAEITMFRLSNNKFFKLSTFVPHSTVQFFCVLSLGMKLLNRLRGQDVTRFFTTYTYLALIEALQLRYKRAIITCYMWIRHIFKL